MVYLSYVGIPDWHFSVGVLEPALMMEGTTSSANLMFIERPEIDNIASQYGAGDTRRGIEIGWSKPDFFWAGDNPQITTSFTGGTTGTPDRFGVAPAMAMAVTNSPSGSSASPTACGPTACPISRSAATTAC